MIAIIVVLYLVFDLKVTAFTHMPRRSDRLSELFVADEYVPAMLVYEKKEQIENVWPVSMYCLIELYPACQ